MRRSFAAVGFLMLGGMAFAQDPVAVDPAHHKIEFENAQLRVLRINIGPGERAVMHSHPCAIAIGLNDSELVMHLPDGSERPGRLARGEVRVVDKPFTHEPENRSGKATEVLLVEMKQGC